MFKKEKTMSEFFERLCSQPRRSEEELQNLYAGFLERLQHQVDIFDNSYNAVIQFKDFLRNEGNDYDICAGFGDVYYSSIPHLLYEGLCIAAKHFKTFLIYRSYGLADDLCVYRHVVELCKRMTAKPYFENIHFILCINDIINYVIMRLDDAMYEELVSINSQIIPILESIQSKIRNEGYGGETYPGKYYAITNEEVMAFVQPTFEQ